MNVIIEYKANNRDKGTYKVDIPQFDFDEDLIQQRFDLLKTSFDACDKTDYNNLLSALNKASSIGKKRQRISIEEDEKNKEEEEEEDKDAFDILGQELGVSSDVIG